MLKVQFLRMSFRAAGYLNVKHRQFFTPVEGTSLPQKERILQEILVLGGKT
jgi:hypothetical protein